MPNLTFKHISNLSEAESAWKQLSPNLVIYDDWDFRFSYYQYLNHPLEFIAAYDSANLVGLLPLMWNEKKEYLDFFAGVNYMEYNRIFVFKEYDYLKEQLWKQITKPAYLTNLDKTMADLPGVEAGSITFQADLSTIHLLQDYLNTYLSSKDRNKLKKLLQTNFTLEENEFEDLHLLVQFSKERFGEKSSFYLRPHWDDFLFSIAKKYDSKITSIVIDNKKCAVGFSIMYNGIFYGINTGRDTSIPGLGKLMSLQKLNSAIKLHASTFDAGSGDFGWKKEFGLIPIPLYTYDTRLPE